MCFINIKKGLLFFILIVFHTMFAAHFGSWLFHYKRMIKVYTANGTEENTENISSGFAFSLYS